jgi:hypothetical protein
MIIICFAGGEHSNWHVHQFSRQHAMVFFPDEKGVDNAYVTSPKRSIPTKNEKAAPSA